LKSQENQIDPFQSLIDPVNDDDVSTNDDALRREKIDDDTESQPEICEREPGEDELNRVEL
jgi:hypothetical protein